jgi:histidinol-phosphate aminotransferase
MFFKKSIKSNENLYIEKEPKKCRINLNLTTNPLGSPMNQEEINKYIEKSLIENYNEPGELYELKEKLSKLNELKKDNIMITAGADQALEIILSHILNEDDFLAIYEPTFSRFEIYAKNIFNAKIIHLKSLSNIPYCKLLILCSPNNPSTIELKYEKIRKILINNPDKMIVIDNVFFGYGNENLSSLVKEFNNLILIKSFSKIYGLPGLRVGWIESKTENIEKLEIGISPFRVSFLNQLIASKSMDNDEFIEKSLNYVKIEYEKIKNELNERVYRESNVPFFIFKTNNPIKDKELLYNKGIKVIDSTYFNNVDFNFLRISIGKPEENEELIIALKELI